MTSVAYRAEPQLPGWLHTTLALVLGWIAAAAAIFALYTAATLVGAISQPYGSQAGVVNEWPYADNGLWSLLANAAVICIALVLATVATSWQLKRRHHRISDGRLAVVLLFCGLIPVAAARPAGGLLGFLIALVLVRHWVARHEDHLAPAKGAVLVAGLSAVVLSYGLLHPLWTAGVSTTPSPKKQRAVEIYIHNAARTGITIDHIGAAPPLIGSVRPARLHIASGADGTIVLSIQRGDCVTGIFDLHTRYHAFGLALSETLPARVSLGRGC